MSEATENVDTVGEDGINALFGSQNSAGSGEDAGTGGSSGSGQENAPEGTQTPSVADAEPEWKDGYVPKAFRGDDGGFNGDQNAVFKSWTDTKRHNTALAAKVKELETAASASAVDAKESDYLNEFDFDALKERAPRAYVGGERDNAIVTDMLKLGHKHGLPVSKVHAFVADYFAGINEYLPDPAEEKDDATLRKEATAYLGPNGQQMMQDIQGFLAARARVNPLPKDQVAVLGEMLKSGPASALLHSLARSAGSRALPSGHEATAPADPEQAKRAAYKMLGASDEEWAAHRDEYLAAARAAGIDQVAA